MSSLYPQNLNFSPARNIPSPHLRANPDAERYSHLFVSLSLIYLSVVCLFFFVVVDFLFLFWWCGLAAASIWRRCWRRGRSSGRSCKCFPFVAASWIKVGPFDRLLDLILVFMQSHFDSWCDFMLFFCLSFLWFWVIVNDSCSSTLNPAVVWD